MTTLQGLRVLQEDAETQVIVLISKPPDPAVAENVLAAAASSAKPVVAIFLGADPATWQGKFRAPIHFASTLTEAARMAGTLCEIGTVELSPVIQDNSVARANQPPYLAALFSGGTLCDEALHIWGEQLGPVYSNTPLNPAWRWHSDSPRQGHYALDLGADEYTRGRPHPMIDPEARLKYLRAAASDPQVGVILLDIVLGYCAHPDPSAIYAPVILDGLQQASQAGRHLHYIISLCGTEGDPQQLSRQQAYLSAAGADVYTSNAAAAQRCLNVLMKPST